MSRSMSCLYCWNSCWRKRTKVDPNPLNLKFLFLLFRMKDWTYMYLLVIFFQCLNFALQIIRSFLLLISFFFGLKMHKAVYWSFYKTYGLPASFCRASWNFQNHRRLTVFVKHRALKGNSLTCCSLIRRSIFWLFNLAISSSCWKIKINMILFLIARRWIFFLEKKQ